MLLALSFVLLKSATVYAIADRGGNWRRESMMAAAMGGDGAKEGKVV